LRFFGYQKGAKNQENWVGDDIQKRFFQKSVFPENFSIEF
jgi:hypothetical protein